MSARQRARTSNDFEPSETAQAVGDLLTTREVAALLHLGEAGIRQRAKRHRIPSVRPSPSLRYWTRRQVERLKQVPDGRSTCRQPIGAAS